MNNELSITTLLERRDNLCRKLSTDKLNEVLDAVITTAVSDESELAGAVDVIGDVEKALERIADRGWHYEKTKLHPPAWYLVLVAEPRFIHIGHLMGALSARFVEWIVFRDYDSFVVYANKFGRGKYKDYYVTATDGKIYESELCTVINGEIKPNAGAKPAEPTEIIKLC
jgi:hypothetical protein